MANFGRFLTRPLYLQVRDVFAERITSGVWKLGVAIPSEIELARELQISVGTVRKALEQLENERLINRRQGRGTFVIDQASQEMTTRFERLRDCDGQFISTDVELATIDDGRASKEEAAMLALKPDDFVVRIERIHHDNGRPFMIERTSLPKRRFPKLDTDRSPPPPIVELALQNGVLLARAEERIMTAAADTRTADQLGVDAGKPLLKLNRVIYAMDGRPIEWRIALCDLADQHYLCEIA